MAESNPKPTRLTEPAATPAATATTPSVPFHAMVATLRRRARRTASARSASGGDRGVVVVVVVPWSTTAIEVLVVGVDVELEVDEVVSACTRRGEAIS